MANLDMNDNSSAIFDEESSKTVRNTASKVFDTNIFAVDFTKGIRKFWYIIISLALLLGTSSAYIKHINYTPMYQSSVSFSVSSATYILNSSASFSSYYDSATAAQLSKTFPYIVNTQMMRNALKSALNTDYINGTISAEAVTSDSNIFKVSVSSNSAIDAYNIVNAIIDVYPDVASFVVGNVELNILIKPIIPEAPYTFDNFIRTGIIMALVGASLGLFLIAFYAFFRNTIRKKDDFKNKLNKKCYVEVPYVMFHRKSDDKNKKNRIVRLTDRHPTFKESFRLLRKRLLRNLKEDEKIIAVTSAAKNEGKTTVALNLAHAFALSGKKTACIDADLRARSLQRYLSAENSEGYTDIFSAGSDNFDSIAFQLEDNLSVFFAGKSNIEFNRDFFEQFFDYLRENYDYVVVNMSPGTEVANVVSVGNLCDCMLFVVKQDSASVDRIRKTLEYMSFSSAKILGFVFNGVQEGFSGYGGYYYYGKYGYGKYGYGKYGYGKYGYGKYGYGRYGYGRHSHGYGYGYGYGYGEVSDEDKHQSHKKHRHNTGYPQNDKINDLPDSEIPDNII